VGLTVIDVLPFGTDTEYERILLLNQGVIVPGDTSISARLAGSRFASSYASPSALKHEMFDNKSNAAIIFFNFILISLS